MLSNAQAGTSQGALTATASFDRQMQDGSRLHTLQLHAGGAAPGVCTLADLLTKAMGGSSQLPAASGVPQHVAVAFASPEAGQHSDSSFKTEQQERVSLAFKGGMMCRSCSELAAGGLLCNGLAGTQPCRCGAGAELLGAVVCIQWQDPQSGALSSKLSLPHCPAGSALPPDSDLSR